jgi:cell division protein FtsQ
VYVNKQGEFELIPRVGNHRILLGGADDISSKLKRLKTFYTSKDVNVKELNMYDTINLKYKNQLVCSNR